MNNLAFQLKFRRLDLYLCFQVCPTIILNAVMVGGPFNLFYYICSFNVLFCILFMSPAGQCLYILEKFV